MSNEYNLMKKGDFVQQCGFLPLMSCLEKNKVYEIIGTDDHPTLPDLILKGIPDPISCTNFKRLLEG